MIEIVKNAPIPLKGLGRKRKHQDIYDLVEMWEVGDSVVFDSDGHSVNGTLTAKRVNALGAIAKRANQKVTVRRNKQDSTIQIWRVQ